MHHSLIDPAKLHVFGESRKHQKMRKSVIQGCANLWGTSMSFLPLTCDAARSLQCPKNLSKDAPKIASHLSNPRGRTWTARDQFSAPFAVAKQYHVAGNTLVDSHLKIRNNDDRDSALKIRFFRTLKIFCEFRSVVNPIGRTNPPNKKGCN